MSWGVVTPDADKDSLLGRLIDEMAIPEYVTFARDVAEAQLAAGKVAAKELLASGAIGLPGSILRVGINGHANESHAKTPEWAHEMLNVVVYELAQPEVPAGSSGPAESESPPADSEASAEVVASEAPAESADGAPAPSQDEVPAEN